MGYVNRLWSLDIIGGSIPPTIMTGIIRQNGVNAMYIYTMEQGNTRVWWGGGNTPPSRSRVVYGVDTIIVRGDMRYSPNGRGIWYTIDELIRGD